MKKIIEKLEKNAVNYEIQQYGGNYFGCDFNVSGVFVSVRNYGVVDNPEENVSTVLKAIARSNGYTVVNNSSYGKESYVIYKTSDYNALREYWNKQKETSEKFWNIYKTCGKEAADVYYKNACRRYNFKIA
jgi:hypothetical protein